jgi:uncharacterized RDD family membrane protein YckC
VQPSAALDTDVAIETPEHIIFRHRVAGPSRRFIAYLTDLLLCYTALAAFTILILFSVVGGAATSGALDGAEGLGIGLWLVIFFAVQWVYFAVLEGWWGRTPGKAALGLRVVTTTGRPIGFRASALRNILRAADALPLTYTAGLLSLAGLFSMAVTRRFQRLGDLVAGTIVVVPERAKASTPVVLWPPVQPAESAQLPDDVRLDADERLAIEMFLRRREKLGQGREMELAQMIAPILSARFSFVARDPSRTLALLYDAAANAGRTDGPPSSRSNAGPWR